MERLTEINGYGFLVLKEQEDKTLDLTRNAIWKLKELEDVLEKYDIESAEELGNYLSPKLFCYSKLSENLDEFKKYC